MESLVADLKQPQYVVNHDLIHSRVLLHLCFLALLSAAPNSYHCSVNQSLDPEAAMISGAAFLELDSGGLNSKLSRSRSGMSAHDILEGRRAF